MNKSYKMVIIPAVIIIAVIAGLLIFRSINSKKPKPYTRNPEYTYGEVPEAGIESIFELTGTQAQTAFDSTIIDRENGRDAEQAYGVHMVYSSETSDGGVVAYDNIMYVYSPDKNEKSGVESAVQSEYMKRKREQSSN